MSLTNALNEMPANPGFGKSRPVSSRTWSRARQPVISFAVALGLVIGAGVAQAAATDDAPSANADKSASDQSPFRDLLSVAGEEVDVDSHFSNGKWTLVMLWATNCHVCHEQKPMISAAHTERKDVDFTVLASQ